MKHATAGGPYRVPRTEDRWRSIGLAAGVHAGLLFFLWIGVQWQSNQPVAVEAEIWDTAVQTAAPPAPTPPTPEPEPEPEPEPRPEPAPPTPPPAPVVPPPRAVAPPVETPPAVDPDIALKKRQAREKAEKQRIDEEKREAKARQEEKEKAEEKAKLAEKQLADKKAKDAEKKKLDEKKLAEEKADELAKEEKAKEEKKAAEKAATKAKADAVAVEQKKRDQARAAEMARITGAVGAGSTGTAAKATAPRLDSGYAAAITAKIKSNIAYSVGDMAGNPRAEFKIEQLPTGEIISVRKIKSSGIPAYDLAVENAIAKSSPLPKKKDGTVEREVTAGFNMKDLPGNQP